MTVKIINFGTAQEMDKYLIPNAIYNETINKNKVKIQEYFIKHPRLMLSFVGFNGALKLANQLAYNKKCGCFYTIPWKTYYDEVFHTKKTSLTFAQQVEEYRYMILNWYPSPRISYMQYLSQIALGMILIINQYLYSIQNNLNDCTLFNQDWYKNTFDNITAFRLYIIANFST
jgi:hypothetical protein